ncbi:unnamed protein product [Protopolystoma xenopodis]|uniref:Uncharacterized protein n=1 Tax=Protopolystoma xenopodis TaxID=117903 RepID=A0A448XDE7_9PLAT|nr:unnamed protein product [Protopolystoma xenopodis]
MPAKRLRMYQVHCKMLGIKTTTMADDFGLGAFYIVSLDTKTNLRQRGKPTSMIVKLNAFNFLTEEPVPMSPCLAAAWSIKPLRLCFCLGRTLHIVHFSATTNPIEAYLRRMSSASTSPGPTSPGTANRSTPPGVGRLRSASRSLFGAGPHASTTVMRAVPTGVAGSHRTGLTGLDYSGWSKRDRSGQQTVSTTGYSAVGFSGGDESVEFGLDWREAVGAECLAPIRLVDNRQFSMKGTQTASGLCIYKEKLIITCLDGLLYCIDLSNLIHYDWNIIYRASPSRLPTSEVLSDPAAPIAPSEDPSNQGIHWEFHGAFVSSNGVYIGLVECPVNYLDNNRFTKFTILNSRVFFNRLLQSQLNSCSGSIEKPSQIRCKSN